jgi:DNA-binding GntR family transcriptional regulator
MPRKSGNGNAPGGETPYEPAAGGVARQLREAIYEGRLQPGQPVRQEAVAKELGVSRIPVREALRLLEIEGLVVIRPHSGARVAMLDFPECEEIYKIRERLEPLAFSESVKHITDEQVEEARAVFVELDGLRDDAPAYLEQDRKLHLACYQGVHTPRLLRTIVSHWNTTQHYRRVLLQTFTPEDYDVQRSEHHLIVEALSARNARVGEELIRAHIERSRLRFERNRWRFDR